MPSCGATPLSRWCENGRPDPPTQHTTAADSAILADLYIAVVTRLTAGALDIVLHRW
jgi:hypothetical protein